MRTPSQTSPLNLLQEQLRGDPWKLLVACIMLNQTSAVQVKRVIWKFFELYPGPDAYFDSAGILGEESIKELIRPLGFKNRRYQRLNGMTWDFLVLRPHENISQIDRVHGVGKYAADSFKMFFGGEIIEDVRDKELRKYVTWAKENFR